MVLLAFGAASVWLVLVAQVVASVLITVMVLRSRYQRRLAGARD
jgi:hypothetical protein